MYDDKNLDDIFKDTKLYKIAPKNSLIDNEIEPQKVFKIVKQTEDLDDYYVADYKMPKFRIQQEQDLLSLLELPEFYLNEGNEYKYKYPHQTKKEEITSRWQTEKGTPNELNQFMRQEANDESIETIKENDLANQEDFVKHDAYIKGLEYIKGDFKGNMEKVLDEVIHKGKEMAIKEEIKKVPEIIIKKQQKVNIVSAMIPTTTPHKKTTESAELHMLKLAYMKNGGRDMRTLNGTNIRNLKAAIKRQVNRVSLSMSK